MIAQIIGGETSIPSAHALFLLPHWFAVILWSEQTNVSCSRRLIWCGCSLVRVNSEHEQCCHVLTYQHILVHKRLHRFDCQGLPKPHILSVPKTTWLLQHGIPDLHHTVTFWLCFGKKTTRSTTEVWFKISILLLYIYNHIVRYVYNLVLSCHHLSKVKSSQLTFTFTMGTSSCLLGENPPCAVFLTRCTISPDFLPWCSNNFDSQKRSPPHRKHKSGS